MSWIKDGLREIASKSEGLDILLVMDFCRAAIPGRGMGTRGAKVELMAFAARKDVSNSKMDGRTFTQHWCKAFTKRLKIGTPFTCEDLREDINVDRVPSVIFLREGCTNHLPSSSWPNRSNFTSHSDLPNNHNGHSR